MANIKISICLLLLCVLPIAIINCGDLCLPESCTLPDCFCPGTHGPPQIPRSDTPQMIMLTLDDAVTDDLEEIYKSIFSSNRLNPNGCPIIGTFYVSNNWTNYKLVKELYSDGHEIASHSLTHQLPQSYWTHMMYETWKKEMNGQRKQISEESSISIDEIRGVRAPFLEVGGDEQFRMMRDAGFLYDATFMSGPHPNGGAWPFTLDYVPSTEYCSNTNCPKRTWPGLWEIPLNRWVNQAEGQSCAMVDSCETQPKDKADALSYFWHNFNRFYRGNKAPLGIHFHATWLKKNTSYLEALQNFIDSVLKLKDVYFVTANQVIEWMKNPQNIKESLTFSPWMSSCDKTSSRRIYSGDTKETETSKSDQISVYQPSLTSSEYVKTAEKRIDDYSPETNLFWNNPKYRKEQSDKRKQYDYTDGEVSSDGSYQNLHSSKMRRSPVFKGYPVYDRRFIAYSDYNPPDYMDVPHHHLYRRNLLGGLIGGKKSAAVTQPAHAQPAQPEHSLNPEEAPASGRGGLLGSLRGGGKKSDNGKTGGNDNQQHTSDSSKGGGLFGGGDKEKKEGEGLLGGVGNLVGGALKGTGDLVGGVVGGTGELLGDVAGGTGDLLGGVVGGAGDLVGGVVGGAGDLVGGVAGGAGDLVGGVVGGAGDLVGGVAGGAGDLVGGVVGGAGDLVGGVVGGAGDLVEGVVGGAGDLVGGVVGGAGDLVGGVVGGAGDLVGGVVGGVGDLVGGIVGGVGSLVNDTLGAVVPDHQVDSKDSGQSLTPRGFIHTMGLIICSVFITSFLSSL